MPPIAKQVALTDIRCLVLPQQVESRTQTETSSLEFTRTSRASDNKKEAIFNKGKRLNISPKKSHSGHSKKGQTSTIKVNKKSLSKMNIEKSST
jgi:hypothetical protein